MDENQFWDIIALFDWSHEGDSHAVMRPAIAVLSQRDLESLYQFDEILAARLYALDTQAHAQPTGFGVDHFSVDSFLYNRCGVLVNGRDYYEKVLENPSWMPANLDFEGVLYLAYYAALQKGIDNYEYFATHSYETFSNEAGWAKADFPDDLPLVHLPKHQQQ